MWRYMLVQGRVIRSWERKWTCAFEGQIEKAIVTGWEQV